MSNRNLKARDIALTGGVERKSRDTWMVTSSDGSRKYYVMNWGDRMQCNCPDSSARKEKCKHIRAVEYMELKERFGDLIG